MSSFFFHSHGQPKWKVESLHGPLSGTGIHMRRAKRASVRGDAAWSEGGLKYASTDTGEGV